MNITLDLQKYIEFLFFALCEIGTHNISQCIFIERKRFYMSFFKNKYKYQTDVLRNTI